MKYLDARTTVIKRGLQALAVLPILLAGCQSDSAPAQTTIMKAATASWQEEKALGQPRGLWTQGGHAILVSDEGALLSDGAVQYRGNLEGLAGRMDDQGQLRLVSIDRDNNQVLLFAGTAQRLQPVQRLPAPDYEINGVCLYRDAQSLLSVFVLDERGGADQWLMDAGESPSLVRHLVLPPGVESCAVDDHTGSLYVAEESVGLWRYNADPERDADRELLDRIAPHGQIAENASAVAALPGGVVLIDKEARAVNLYHRDGQLQRRLSVPDLDEPEGVAVNVDEDRLTLYALDDGEAGVVRAVVSWTAETAPRKTTAVVLPTVETDSVERFGDAADDPAIWINQSSPQDSRILGTDKKAGLYVYDLKGQARQFLEVGRLNNVDLRYGVTVADRQWDIAVASNRDNNSLHVFLIDPENGQVQDVGEIPTGMQEIYGLCLYRDDQGLYAFANDKSGLIEQWQLQLGDGVGAERMRQLQVASQPEGCVADERSQRLFVGEEGEAVWVFAAGADQPVEAEKVMAAGDILVADIEGLALYQNEERNWLVVSSQGDNSYVILDAQAPYDVAGKFRIGLNADAGIDGASETDGLEVTAVNLGGDFDQGLLVVQDGRNRLPDAPQNYKIVPWKDIEAVLGNP